MFTRCSVCGAMILFGERRIGPYAFCDDDCEAALVAKAVKSLPAALIAATVDRIRQEKCPECRGDGPVDSWPSYRVWSFAIATRRVMRSPLSCARCASRRLRNDILITELFGWWGLPFGPFWSEQALSENRRTLTAVESTEMPSAHFVSGVILSLARERLGSQHMNPPIGASNSNRSIAWRFGFNTAKLLRLAGREPLFLILSSASIALLATAMAGTRSGDFYIILNLLVTSTALYSVAYLREGTTKTVSALHCILAGVYNPFFRVPLAHSTWWYVNLLAIALLSFTTAEQLRSCKPSQK